MNIPLRRILIFSFDMKVSILCRRLSTSAIVAKALIKFIGYFLLAAMQINQWQRGK